MEIIFLHIAQVGGSSVLVDTVSYKDVREPILWVYIFWEYMNDITDCNLVVCMFFVRSQETLSSPSPDHITEVSTVVS